MKKEGLLIEPEFDNINKYLESGTRTQITDVLKKLSEQIHGNTDGMLVRNILVWIHENTIRLHDGSDPRKFKRTASEILLSGERTGCCDSSTLFAALARSKGIPTMQIITLSKKWGTAIDNGIKLPTSGHYFVASYLTDVVGNSKWILIDSDRTVRDTREVNFVGLDLQNRNIGDLYAFAYVKDYYDDLHIDSIKSINDIQLKAYRMCDRSDFSFELER